MGVSSKAGLIVSMLLLVQQLQSTSASIPDVIMSPNRTDVTVPPDEQAIVVFEVCYPVEFSYDIRTNWTFDESNYIYLEQLPVGTTHFTHDNTMSAGYSIILLDLPPHSGINCQEVVTRLFNRRGLNFQTLRIVLKVIFCEGPSVEEYTEYTYFNITMAEHDPAVVDKTTSDPMVTEATTNNTTPPCPMATTEGGNPAAAPPAPITERDHISIGFGVVLVAIIAVLIMIILVLSYFLHSYRMTILRTQPQN